MSASTIPAAVPDHKGARPRRSTRRRLAKVAVWVLGIPCILLIALYLTLLITPVRLPFGGDAVRTLARSALPPTSTLALGNMNLALEKGVWPVLQFSPVTLTDSKSGARIAIDALEVGFSPVRTLFGQPGATITVVGPHIQVVQDLYGPRPTSFEVIENPQGGQPTVQVQEGDEAFPAVGISKDGIRQGADRSQLAMRSDNDWLKFNLEASEKGIAEIVAQAAQGRFSKLVVRDGTMEMNDSVYGLFRRFDHINLEIGPSADGRDTAGTFSAAFGKTTMVGSLSRTVDDAGNSRLEADVTNVDFAAIMPLVDDGTNPGTIRGAGALSIDVNFEPAGGKLVDGRFKIDLTGLDLVIDKDSFPIVSSIMDITWNPDNGQFTLADSALQIGQSSARISGVFGMGLDPTFGPTIGISFKARDVFLHPNDMAAPQAPFDSMDFSGWSAPLYGAMGIDRFIARKGEGSIESTGRIDMLQNGFGVDMTVVGDKIRADDFKRIWPWLMGKESRDWFVANVPDGLLAPSRMEFKIPVGALALGAKDQPLPDDAMMIDINATGVTVKPTADLDPIALEGTFNLHMQGGDVTMSAGGGRIATAAGDIVVANPTMVMDNSKTSQDIFEISGDLKSPIPAVLDIVDRLQPDALKGVDLPVDLKTLTGNVDLGLVATISLADEARNLPMKVDYVVNGSLAGFGSSQPIQNLPVSNGEMAFSASQDGYQLGGTIDIAGFTADVEVEGTPTGEPKLRLGADVEVADLKGLGVDVSDYLSGQLRFVAQPQADGAIGIGVDLTKAALTIKDIGIRKAAGTTGSLTAVARMDGDLTKVSDIDLAFGSVRAQGKMEVDAKSGLRSAEFSRFALSDGDNASLSLKPMDGGYSVSIQGKQLDLKPMLSNIFSLGQGAGGIQPTQLNQTVALSVKLDRALGYYATTAFNVDMSLLLAGSDMRRANLTAQFSEGNSISVTTNPAPNGRTLSVAFNDAGTILRLLGIYSQLAGGEGNLVLTTDRKADAESGQLVLRNFAIVDEANVAQVLGNHPDSRAVIAQQNRLDFDAAKVDFVRKKDRVEVLDAVLAGDMVGGTMRGYIYTNQRQYDLTGTYVPLFGLNNAFQKIPLLGPLLGGRDGEGLLGVTFAVEGPLDNPKFRINPLSALVPGAFRELFEFQAKERPPGQ